MEKKVSPEEKGRLLLDMVKRGKPVLGMDFSDASLKKAHLARKDHTALWQAIGALIPALWSGQMNHHSGFRLLRAVGANLQGADLRGADLQEARLFGSDLQGADLRGADLHGANLFMADLREADLRSANLHNAELNGIEVQGSKLSAATFTKSGWTFEYLQDLVNRGAIVVDMEQVFRTREGLTLFFQRHLSREDRFFIDGVIVGVLGGDTDCEVDEYRTQGEGSLLRLKANSTDDLLAVAKTVHERLWRESSSEGSVLPASVQPDVFRAGLEQAVNALEPEKTELHDNASNTHLTSEALLQELKKVVVRDIRAAAHIACLFETLFNVDGLMMWLAGFDAGAEIIPEIDDSSLRRAARQTATALQRRGAIPEAMTHLIEARPGRLEEIQQVVGTWRQLTQRDPDA